MVDINTIPGILSVLSAQILFPSDLLEIRYGVLRLSSSWVGNFHIGNVKYSINDQLYVKIPK
jgi:hypothetical protein